MLRKTGIVLWILVLIVGALWIYSKARRAPVETLPGNTVIIGPDGEIVESDGGKAFVSVPWKWLPGIKRFELTERSGDKFSSSDLAGKPYVIGFFFSHCPTICRDLNRQIQRLSNEFRDTDLTFLSLSVDPERDTPERLAEYAREFDADPQRWLFLRGQMYKIRDVGEKQLNTVVNGTDHTGDLFLVDRWGRYRDRFTWDDASEMKRFSEVARDVLAETEPPLDAVVRTRNVYAGLPHDDQKRLPWLYDFQLIDQQGEPFWSRDLTGKPWVASFFFSRCGSVCPRQNRFLADIQSDISGRGAELVSITTDPEYDTPSILRQYASTLNAGDHWHFLTGSYDYIRRVGSEFLGIAADGEHHASLLVVVDKWGYVRGRFDWQQPGAAEAMLSLIDQLQTESRPAGAFEIITGGAGEAVQ